MASRLPVGTWILCFIVVCGLAGSAQAVDRLVPQEYPTIQEGINAAKTGDIVLVSPGVYNELIDFLGKTITVRSTDGPAVTIIDGGGSGPIVTFQNLEGPGSVLEGFTITNGVAAEGAGITILDAYPTILNNTISSNTATTGSGGGIVLRNYTPNFDQNLIPQIAGNIITGNISLNQSGGGFYAYSKYDFPVISGNTWTMNQSNWDGSVMSAHGPPYSNNHKIIFSNETMTGIDLSPQNIPREIVISDIDLLIQDSDIGIYNNSSWDGGLQSNRGNVEIKSSTLRSLPMSNGQNSSTVAELNTATLILEEVTLINETQATDSRFRTYVYSGYADLNNPMPTAKIKSNRLTSIGVLPEFYTGYSFKSFIELTDTNVIDSKLSVEAYAFYLDSEIDIENLTLSGELTDLSNQAAGRASLYISNGSGYNSTPATKGLVNLSNIKISDLTIADNQPNVISLNSWSIDELEINVDNLDTGGLASNSSAINSVLRVVNSNYSYYDNYIPRNIDFSLRNSLIVNPTTTASPLNFLFDSADYYGLSNYSFSVSGVTVTGPQTDSALMKIQGLDTINGDLDLRIENSIIDGNNPVSAIPSTTPFDLSVTHTLAPVPLPGDSNFEGQPTFVTGPEGDFYLSQIRAGNSIDSLGVDSGDPISSAPFQSGTRSDGGLDTGNPDLGYHYPTRTEPSRVELQMDDGAQFYEPGTGLIDSTLVSVYLNELESSANGTTPWRGFSLRLLQEADILQISSVLLSDELLATLGSAPEYFEALVCGDILTIAMIPSLTDPAITFTASPSIEILQFEMTAGPLLQSSDEVLETQWIPQDGSGCGGILEVANVVTNSLGESTPLNKQPLRLTLVPYSQFVRADANTDGQTDIGDAVSMLTFLFNGLGELQCLDSADVNDDGLIDVADPIALLAALFTAGSPPPDPGQLCGPDPTEDALRCDRYDPCTPSSSIDSFSANALSPKRLQLNWSCSGPIDQFQILINGTVHQRLGGDSRHTVISSIQSGIQEICLLALSKGSIQQSCIWASASEPVTDLSCRMDTQSPNTFLEWTSLNEFEVVEIYHLGDLIAVVPESAEFAEITLPDTGLQEVCVVGRLNGFSSVAVCCQVQSNDECFGSLTATNGNLNFFSSTLSADAYQTNSCRVCWEYTDPIYFNSVGGDRWYSHIATQSGLLEFFATADMVVYRGTCNDLIQEGCGDGVRMEVTAGEEVFIRLGGSFTNTYLFQFGYPTGILPPVVFSCSSGFDPNTGEYRVSWRIDDLMETVTVTLDGTILSTVPSADGTYLIPGLVSGSTYDICLTGQIGSAASQPNCQTVTVP